MDKKVVVAGVGMTQFSRPSKGHQYQDLASLAVSDALSDAEISYSEIERAFAGYVFGDSTCGQHALYQLGMTGIPITNLNNNCATGTTALLHAADTIRYGIADCVLALGFEQMSAGALQAVYKDRENPLRDHIAQVDAKYTPSNEPYAARLFGAAGREYAATHGMDARVFASIAVKARRHAEHNPRAVFRAQVSIDEVLNSPPIFEPLTRLQCCPPTSGAAAVILVSEDFAARHAIKQDIVLREIMMVTDPLESLESGSMLDVVGSALTKTAAAQLYERTGVDPYDIDVVELHDCFTTNELISYEALGLTEEGTAERFIADGDNSYGGRVVTNPSGGLLSKGHPLGATGLAQCAELVWQLRGDAGPRQVEGAKLALQHNIGLGGACIVGLYEKSA